MCTYRSATELLMKQDYAGALGIAGPILENNTGDLAAWQLTARALHGLGEAEIAMKNLFSIAEATLEKGRPITALALIKEIEALGGDPGALIDALAASYGAGSDRVEEVEMAPPPLPVNAAVQPWDVSGDLAGAIERAKKAMAVAWGETLTTDDMKRPLPFIPILSALAPDDLCLLVRAFTRHVFAEDQTVVEQGTPGDAIYMIAEGEVTVIRHPERGEPRELARLGPGAFFGEMSLVSRAPRAAEVRAREHTVVLRAQKADIESLVERAPEIGNVLVAFCHARMLENLMRISPVLSPVPATRRPDVIAMFGTDYREAGSVIIREGQEGKGLFLIVSGEVNVLKREKREQVMVARLGPGDLFGEISLLMRRPSTATVVAAEDTALLSLPSADFGEVTREFPELLKGAFDIAIEREEKNNSILASSAAAADDLVLV